MLLLFVEEYHSNLAKHPLALRLSRLCHPAEFPQRLFYGVFITTKKENPLGAGS